MKYYFAGWSKTGGVWSQTASSRPFLLVCETRISGATLALGRIGIGTGRVGTGIGIGIGIGIGRDLSIGEDGLRVQNSNGRRPPFI